MREVRVESLDGLEMAGGEVRLVTNAGELALVSPEGVWEAFGRLSLPLEPSTEELRELDAVRQGLAEHAAAAGFASILENVPCGSDGSGSPSTSCYARPARSPLRRVTSSSRW